MDALGATVSLAAPYFPAEDHAEARLLKATVLLDHCRFAEAREIITPAIELALRLDHPAIERLGLAGKAMRDIGRDRDGRNARRSSDHRALLAIHDLESVGRGCLAQCDSGREPDCT